MNRTAYFTTDLFINALEKLLKAKTQFHGQGNIPDGPIIYVINHFTRIETLLLPYYLFHLTNKTIRSLAAGELFKGGLKNYFEMVGVLSTKDPERDTQILQTLLTDNAHWIIFPEGRMVKTKKLIRRGKFMIGDDHSSRSPHTGAASLAIRAEMFRRALTTQQNPQDQEKLRLQLGLETEDQICPLSVKIVPVNLTYYPIRSDENLLTDVMSRLVKDPSERMIEELMTEGTMLLQGVDIDIKFSQSIDMAAECERGPVAEIIAQDQVADYQENQRVMQFLRKRSSALMQQYMEGIYSATTINHDHLFASIIRSWWGGSFRPEDLARRVYLVSKFIKKNKSLQDNLHTSLKEEQSHLLIDDRFDKLANFLELSRELNSLDREGTHYRKNREFWKTPPLFHETRLLNPTEVMANEIEPLRDLQHYLKWLSFLPTPLVRKLVGYQIFTQERAQFQAEHKEGAENVMLNRNDARPFLLPALSSRIGVVFVHSYLAAPAEVLPCARALRKAGAWVYGVRLPGHGTTPEILATKTWEQWRDAVELGYGLMDTICDKVVLIGFSAGGALVLELASRLEKLAGVVAICPPKELQDYSKRFMPPTQIWNRLLARWKGNSTSDEFVEFEPEVPEVNYFLNPIAGVYEVGKLLEQMSSRLEQVKHRALLLSSTDDQVIGSKNNGKIFEQLGSERKEHYTVKSTRHNIIYGPGSERIHEIIASFVSSC